MSQENKKSNRLLLLALLAVAAAAALLLYGWKMRNGSGRSSTYTFDLIQAHRLGGEVPLLGSFEAGTKAFRQGNGRDEAIAEFTIGGPYFVDHCSPACHPEGLDGPIDLNAVPEIPATRRIQIPMSGGVIEGEKGKYIDASLKYARAFNSKMFDLITSTRQAK